MCIGLLRLPRKSKTAVVAHRRLSATRRDSYAMGPTVWSLLVVGFLACLMHLTTVRSQCTTKHCDQGDNELSVLTAMVARLQDTMEQQQHSMEQLQIQMQLLNKQQPLNQHGEPPGQQGPRMYRTSFNYYYFCKSNLRVHL